MIYTLTVLGLVLVPYYDIIFRLFPNVTVVAIDTRGQREMIAVIIALAIGLSALYRGIKPFKNKWFLIFVFLQLVAIKFIPKTPIIINGIDNSFFWVWKPLFEMLCFLLMLIGLSGSTIDFRRVLKVMYWCGLTMACYVILQSAGFDPFFKTKPIEIIGQTMFAGRVGTLGQPTLVSPFIAMIIPIALYLRKYIFALIMGIAVYLTHSQMAMGALIGGLILYTCLNRPKWSFVLIPSSIITLIYLFSNYKDMFEKFSNGRFYVWKNIIQDVLQTKIKGYEGLDFSFFGHGLGAFPYISLTADQTTFASPHSLPLSVLYSCGIFGVIILSMAIIGLFCEGYKVYLYDKRKATALLCALTIILLCSTGSFVLGLGIYWFYTITIISLLLNTSLKGETI